MSAVFYQILNPQGDPVGRLEGVGGLLQQTWSLRGPGLRGVRAGARFKAVREAGPEAPWLDALGPLRTERLAEASGKTRQDVEALLRGGGRPAQRQLDPGAVTVWAGRKSLGSVLIAVEGPGVYLEAWAVADGLWSGALEAFELQVEVVARDLDSAQEAISVAAQGAGAHPTRVLRCSIT